MGKQGTLTVGSIVTMHYSDEKWELPIESPQVCFPSREVQSSLES